jgi:hypothetical protein
MRIIGSGANSSICALYIGILYCATHVRSTAIWPYAFMAIGALAFFAWIINYRQLRLVAHTPISRIDSAAQGFVELVGRAEQIGTTPLLSHLTKLPCVWYRYKVVRKNTRESAFNVTFSVDMLQNRLSESGSSDQSFLINDGSGSCVIDPKGAEVQSSAVKTWTEGPYRYIEWLLLPDSDIYATGEFKTVGGNNSEFDLEGEVSRWLTELKQDHAKLLARFDLNQDGEIDAMEWELARRQARREVEAQRRATLLIGGAKVLTKPADGKPFLISNDPPDRLRRKMFWWSWAHIAVFLVSGSTAFIIFTSANG